ncbi:hypothetical protein [Agrobacterium pusense]|uniref:Uncharacterized protein n=1 Tax=Agrobacterium pusense TaxID=648995 RepID=A0AA44EMP2_9HYPH|nr:hypothetical protein [Agrobacterium pusense]NRF10921.1 hypothetical protein [Agrobacterium pusense]NRF21631.1 hypothetical protein [Agrobacterium pusense]HCJ70401.1 hypothetical protein [Agrobacterium sp.]
MPHFLQTKVTGLRGRMRRHARNIECAPANWREIKRCRNDEEALKLSGKLAHGNMLAAWLLHQQNPKADGYAEGYVEDQWVRQTARLYNARSVEQQLCMKIEARAIEEFAGARMTREVEERATQLLARLSLVYLDVNDGEWTISDNVRVRMVFIDKCIFRDRYLVVIEFPDNELRLVQWAVEDGTPTQFQFDHFHRDDDSLIALFGIDALNLVPLCAKLPLFGVDVAEMAVEIMRMCRLSLVWLDTDRTATEPVPNQAARGTAGRRNRAQGGTAADLHDRICFNHVRPRRQRVQEGNGEGGPHQFNHRVWVTGHFKLQAYGKKRALRKMIWVNEFLRGPNEAPIRRRALIVRPRHDDPTFQGEV